MKRPQMLETLDGMRASQNMTREVMAEKMERESGEPWDKSKLDKTLTSESMPRTETYCLMLTVLKQPTLPWKWCRSKRSGDDE